MCVYKENKVTDELNKMLAMSKSGWKFMAITVKIENQKEKRTFSLHTKSYTLLEEIWRNFRNFVKKKSQIEFYCKSLKCMHSFCFKKTYLVERQS